MREERSSARRSRPPVLIHAPQRSGRESRRLLASWVGPVCMGALVLALAACSNTRSRPSSPSVSSSATAHPEYKVGAPYQVNGIWYYPQEDYSYDETGIASFYKDSYNGKLTSNGEIYDGNLLTAAHRTLPMPTLVRVTNLDNGRSIVVRVNDRGPYNAGRIIDLSHRAAEMLEMTQSGTAKVRVQVLTEESQLMATKMKTQQLDKDVPPIAAAPRSQMAAESLAPPSGVKQAAPSRKSATLPGSRIADSATPRGALEDQGGGEKLEEQVVELHPVKSTQIYIQAGAFTRYDNANRRSAQVSGVGKPSISTFRKDNRDYYRVRIGPIASPEQADSLLQAVISQGVPDAQVIVE